MRPVRALPRRLAGVLTGVLAVAIACAPPASAPSPRPVAVPDAPGMRDLLDAPWTVRRPAGTHTNAIQLSSELVSRVDSVESTDSTTAAVSVTWTRLAGGEPARISGLVTDYRVGSAAAEPGPLAGLLVPVPFSAAEGRSTTQAQLEVPPSAACSLAAAVLQAVRELFVSAPPRLVAGDTWSDSSTYAICRDSIPLEVRSARLFRVIGAERRGNAAVVVLLDRTSTVTLRGEGTQFGEQVSIAAEGSGAMRLELNLESGAVVAARGDAELRMTMRGRRRSQDLKQHTRIEIRAP